MAPPPGMGPPPTIAGAPGMAPPGTAPPGVVANAAPSRPAGIPASFQGAANMPNINFSAPVIRLGTGPKAATPDSRSTRGSDERSSGRPGLGMDKVVDAAQQRRDQLLNLPPPTKDEIVRTIFVAGITEGCGGDVGIERILRTAGHLRRWDRAIDADGKDCTFGFAQYEDPESLQTAVEVLKDIEVPVKKQTPSAAAKKERKEGEDADEEKEPEIEKKNLLVFVDDNSLKYLENWSNNRGDNPAADQARLGGARAALKAVIHDLFHPSVRTRIEDADGDTQMRDTPQDGESVEVVNIPMTQADDELSDIPAEMREMVSKEIAAFRDRSIRRDMERLKREEEMEAAERARNGARPSRLDSPGPTGGSNNIPLGPRGILAGAPSGPKGGQMPKDYQKNANFVNGSGTNGASSGQVWIDRADEDDSASDSELERRRITKKKEAEEKAYMDQERRWLNRERSRTAAVEREKERDEAEEAKLKIAAEKMAEKLKNWNDDEQAAKRVDDYFADRSAWLRNRSAYRAREIAADDADRIEEEKENERAGIKKPEPVRPVSRNGEAGGFKMDMAPKSHQQQPFKLSLGAAAAQKAQTVKSQKRTVAEVEGLLEDEEDESKQTRRQLIPIKFDPADRAAMTEEEREQAIKELAANIPTDKEGLWKWDVQWEFVDEGVIVDKLTPFVKRKIVEYLGVQEDTIVGDVEEHIRKRGSPAELVKSLEKVCTLPVLLL